MNIRHTIYIYMVTVVVIVACSSNDDVLNGISTDEQQLKKEQMMSETPITFASAEFLDLQWETEDTLEEVTRGGSVDIFNFAMDSVGIFCLSRTQLADAPKNVSWSGAYPLEEQNLHNVWIKNEMAQIENINGSKGKIVWNNTNLLNFYPLNAWYTYGFVAYHPWTEYIEMGKTYVRAYIQVDGNDDVLYAMAKSPERQYGDASVDGLAFSKQYYDAINNNGLDDEGAYPLFQFRHLMSRLDFSFYFKETPDRNFHVDKVEFDDFINLMSIMLARQSNGDMTETISDGKVYATSAPTAKFPALTSFMGHFELREKGETPISGIMAGSEYKYNLSSEPKKVGDCILIPPVKNLPSANIELYVTLCDDAGNKYRNASAIKIAVPSSGWKMGARYNICIKFDNNPGSSSAPAMRAPATETTADGVTLWQPEATVSISK